MDWTKILITVLFMGNAMLVSSMAPNIWMNGPWSATASTPPPSRASNLWPGSGKFQPLPKTSFITNVGVTSKYSTSPDRQQSTNEELTSVIQNSGPIYSTKGWLVMNGDQCTKEVIRVGGNGVSASFDLPCLANGKTRYYVNVRGNKVLVGKPNEDFCAFSDKEKTLVVIEHGICTTRTYSDTGAQVGEDQMKDAICETIKARIQSSKSGFANVGPSQPSVRPPSKQKVQEQQQYTGDVLHSVNANSGPIYSYLSALVMDDEQCTKEVIKLAGNGVAAVFNLPCLENGNVRYYVNVLENRAVIGSPNGDFLAYSDKEKTLIVIEHGKCKTRTYSDNGVQEEENEMEYGICEKVKARLQSIKSGFTNGLTFNPSEVAPAPNIELPQSDEDDLSSKHGWTTGQNVENVNDNGPTYKVMINKNIVNEGSCMERITISMASGHGIQDTFMVPCLSAGTRSITNKKEVVVVGHPEEDFCIFSDTTHSLAVMEREKCAERHYNEDGAMTNEETIVEAFCKEVKKRLKELLTMYGSHGPSNGNSPSELSHDVYNEQPSISNLVSSEVNPNEGSQESNSYVWNSGSSGTTNGVDTWNLNKGFVFGNGNVVISDSGSFSCIQFGDRYKIIQKKLTDSTGKCVEEITIDEWHQRNGINDVFKPPCLPSGERKVVNYKDVLLIGRINTGFCIYSSKPNTLYIFQNGQWKKKIFKENGKVSELTLSSSTDITMVKEQIGKWERIFDKREEEKAKIKLVKNAEKVKRKEEKEKISKIKQEEKRRHNIFRENIKKLRADERLKQREILNEIKMQGANERKSIAAFQRTMTNLEKEEKLKQQKFSQTLARLIREENTNQKQILLSMRKLKMQENEKQKQEAIKIRLATRRGEHPEQIARLERIEMERQQEVQNSFYELEEKERERQQAKENEHNELQNVENERHQREMERLEDLKIKEAARQSQESERLDELRRQESERAMLTSQNLDGQENEEEYRHSEEDRRIETLQLEEDARQAEEERRIEEELNRIENEFYYEYKKALSEE